MSAENSQQLSDWYSPSHFIHGLLFYCADVAAVPAPAACGLRAIGALILECAWEILENTPMIIDRYREATIALGYRGDSVINSVFDVLFMLLGFRCGAAPAGGGVGAIGLFLEIGVGASDPRQSYPQRAHAALPLDSILAWQAGG